LVDMETLSKAGYLPATFLRGCGLSNEAIQASYREKGDSLASALESESQYHSCFISYSAQDKEFVEKLHFDLQSQGVRCWFAPKDMRIGDSIRDTVYQAIRQHEKLLVVLSRHSVTSRWVEDEVEKAFGEEIDRDAIVIFPISIDDAVMGSTKAWAEKIRLMRHIGDFKSYMNKRAYGKALKRLMVDLRRQES
jgi:hypothetical protein